MANILVNQWFIDGSTAHGRLPVDTWSIVAELVAMLDMTDQLLG